MKGGEIYKILIVILVVFFTSCSSSNEDCSKEIKQDYVIGIGGKAYYYTETKQVSCDQGPQAEPIEGVRPLLKEFKYDVLKFEFNPDMGNNKSRLYFEVKLQNLSKEEVKGIPVFKIRTNNNLDSETTYETYLKQSCASIPANSNCTVIVEIEANHGGLTSGTIELKDVEYVLVRKER